MLAEPQNLASLSRRIYESAGFLPQTRMVCSRIVTALELVGCGLGIVLAPEIYSLPGYAQKGVRYFHIEPLATDQIDVRQICLVYRKSLYLHAGNRVGCSYSIDRWPPNTSSCKHEMCLAAYRTKKQPAQIGLLIFPIPAHFSSNPSIVRSSN